jgi:hypothetical protein
MYDAMPLQCLVTELNYVVSLLIHEISVGYRLHFTAKFNFVPYAIIAMARGHENQVHSAFTISIKHCVTTFTPLALAAATDGEISQQRPLRRGIYDLSKAIGS